MSVDKLIDQLGANLYAYMTGTKFPRKLRLDELSQIAERMQSETDKGVAARAEGVVANGDTIACGEGCNGCCEEPILVFRPEAAHVWRWLVRPENRAAKEHFLGAYKAWKAQVGTAHEAVGPLYLDDDATEQAHVAGWRLRAMCPFNREGSCTIYPVRPITCRNGHALNTGEHCHGGSQKPAVRATFVPLDSFVERARQLYLAAQNAARVGKQHPEPLADVVYAMLKG